MRKKILVTGGAGYIGSHVTKLLGENEFDVVVLDNLSTGHEQAVLRAKLIVGDLNNLDKLEEIFQSEKFDAVMHFAGSIVVPESVTHPIDYYQNNTVNSLNLINMCIKHNVGHFVFSSTAAVYGELKNGVAKETDETAPLNPYGYSKLMTEQMLKDTSSAYSGFNFVALRYFNVSGADLEGKIGQAFPGATHLIKVNCEAAVGRRDKVYIFGDDFGTKDGTGVRDYIHVVDLANAHLASLNYLFQGGGSDIFNCGYGHGFSVTEVINTVKKVTQADYVVEKAPRRDGDPGVLVSNVDKIKARIGWTPQHDDLEFIIKTAYDWEKSDTLSTWKRSY